VSLWLRARYPAALTSAFLASAVLVGLFGSKTAQTPAIIGTASGLVAWAMFLAVIPSTAITIALRDVRSTRETAAVRYVWPRDTLLWLGFVALSTITPGVALGLDNSSWALYTRNVMILSGISVTLVVLVNERWSVSAVVSLIIFTSSYAPGNPGAHVVRLLQPDGNAWAGWLGASVASLAALAAIPVGRTMSRTEIL